jgi:hypothetical protein
LHGAERSENFLLKSEVWKTAKTIDKCMQISNWPGYPPLCGQHPQSFPQLSTGRHGRAGIEFSHA